MGTPDVEDQGIKGWTAIHLLDRMKGKQLIDYQSFSLSNDAFIAIPLYSAQAYQALFHVLIQEDSPNQKSSQMEKNNYWTGHSPDLWHSIKAPEPETWNVKC